MLPQSSVHFLHLSNIFEVHLIAHKTTRYRLACPSAKGLVQKGSFSTVFHPPSPSQKQHLPRSSNLTSHLPLPSSSFFNLPHTPSGYINHPTTFGQSLISIALNHLHHFPSPLYLSSSICPSASIMTYFMRSSSLSPDPLTPHHLQLDGRFVLSYLVKHPTQFHRTTFFLPHHCNRN